MGDPYDEATDLEMAHREAAIAAARARMSGISGAAACRDCGDPIPAARKQAVPNAVRCCDCESHLELRARRR